MACAAAIMRRQRVLRHPVTTRLEGDNKKVMGMLSVAEKDEKKPTT